MADVATKPAAKKAASKPKKTAEHPKYSDMVAAAINALKQRGGCSKKAILKYITANYKVGTNEKIINAHTKAALRAGVSKNILKQVKGTGASGSFKMGEVKATKAKPKKATKPKAAKPKKKAAKKPAAKKAKTPKKAAAKKPAAKKAAAKPKKAKTPKKAAAKKPAAKKPAAKKAAKPKKAKTPKKAAK